MTNSGFSHAIAIAKGNFLSISPHPARRSRHQTMKLTAHHRKIYDREVDPDIWWQRHRGGIEELVKEVEEPWLTFPGILNHQNLPQNYYWRFVDLLPRLGRLCRDGHIHSLIAEIDFSKIRWSPQAKNTSRSAAKQHVLSYLSFSLNCKTRWGSWMVVIARLLVLRRYIPIVTVDW